MAYQMAATAVTLNDLEGLSQVAGLFKCNPLNICAAFYTISTDRVLARFLCISRASCFYSSSICNCFGYNRYGISHNITYILPNIGMSLSLGYSYAFKIMLIFYWLRELINEASNADCLRSCAVGLTENPAVLRHWMLSHPEMAHLIQEFEGSTKKRQDTDGRQHEQKRHVPMAFAQDVQSFRRAMEEIGNPFAQYSSDLLVLKSRDVVDTAVAETVRQMKKLELELYETDVEERLVNQTVPITDAIKRNNLHLFSCPPVKEKSRKQLHVVPEERLFALLQAVHCLPDTPW